MRVYYSDLYHCLFTPVVLLCVNFVSFMRALLSMSPINSGESGICDDDESVKVHNGGGDSQASSVYTSQDSILSR